MDKSEFVVVEFTLYHAKSFLLMCMYRPPTSGVDYVSFENLRNILKGVDKTEKEMIVIGDTTTVTLKTIKRKCQETQNDSF